MITWISGFLVDWHQCVHLVQEGMYHGGTLLCVVFCDGEWHALCMSHSRYKTNKCEGCSIDKPGILQCPAVNTIQWSALPN